MADKNTFTKIAKKILQSSKGLRSSQIIHPEREWLVGVAVAVVMLIVSITWSVSEYASYRNIDVTDYSETARVEVYRESMVADALEAFSQRAEEHQALLGQVVQSSVIEPAESTDVTEEVGEENNTEEILETEESTEAEAEADTLDEGEIVPEEEPQNTSE